MLSIGGTLLDLLLKNKEELVGNATIEGSFGFSDCNVDPEGSEIAK